jgi:hypothetical protein
MMAMRCATPDVVMRYCQVGSAGRDQAIHFVRRGLVVHPVNFIQDQDRGAKIGLDYVHNRGQVRSGTRAVTRAAFRVFRKTSRAAIVEVFKVPGG